MNKEKRFKEIFVAFYPKVYGFALKSCGQKWLAEEIAHNVFCKLWMHRNSIGLFKDDNDDDFPVNALSGYIFVITRNEVNDYYRSKKQIEKLRSSFAEQLCYDARVEQRIDAETALELVDEVIEVMPPVRREVFTLSRFHNYTNDQIAKKLNISKRTVEKHINLSLNQLRFELSAYQL